MQTRAQATGGQPGIYPTWEEMRRFAFRVAYAKGCTPQDAEDIAQDALLKVFRAYGGRMRNPTSCLAVVVRNLAAEHWKKEGRRKEHPMEQGEYKQAAPESPMPCENEVPMLLNAVPPIYRQAFLMHFSGFTYPELAERLSTSEVNARVRVCRARRILRSLVLTRSTHSERRNNHDYQG